VLERDLLVVQKISSRNYGSVVVATVATACSGS